VTPALLLAALLALAPAPAPLVVDAGDVESAIQLDEATAYAVCATPRGQVAFCGTREALCWDQEHHQLAACRHVLLEDRGRSYAWYQAHMAAAQLLDGLSTGIARATGAVEANPALGGDPHDPSTGVEIRIGAKGLIAIAEGAGLYLVDRGLKRPKLARITTYVLDALYVGIAAHNLVVADRSRKARR